MTAAHDRVPSAGEQRVWAIYKAVWATLAGPDLEGPDCANSVLVRYSGMFRNGEAGEFARVDSDHPRPQIVLARPSYREPADEPSMTLATGESADLLAELVTLAHEGGHLRSWRAGNHTPEYIEAAIAMHNLLEPGNVVTPEQERLYLEEEHRAWDHARSLLAEHGFEEWDDFQEAKARGLNEYRRIFSGEIHQTAGDDGV